MKLQGALKKCSLDHGYLWKITLLPVAPVSVPEVVPWWQDHRRNETSCCQICVVFSGLHGKTEDTMPKDKGCKQMLLERRAGFNWLGSPDPASTKHSGVYWIAGCATGT